MIDMAKNNNISFEKMQQNLQKRLKNSSKFMKRLNQYANQTISEQKNRSNSRIPNDRETSEEQLGFYQIYEDTNPMDENFIENNGIIIGNTKGSIVNINGDYIHYDGKKIKLENFKNWRNLERNSDVPNGPTKKAIEKYMEDANRFKAFMDDPTNKGKDIDRLLHEFEEQLHKQYKSKITKKDKFGYSTEKTSKDRLIDEKIEEAKRRRETKEERKTIINGKQYVDSTNIEFKGISMTGFRGESTIASDQAVIDGVEVDDETTR